MAAALRIRSRWLGPALVWLALLSASTAVDAKSRPSIVVITVDALRADRLGCYGYARDTSPNIDALVAQGVRFERARTPEPLTGPAMCSMVTGLPPHQHAATRNGLRMLPGLDSLPKILAQHGWETAAFVGTWTLKDNLTLLGEHFGTYGERLERRRWFGILNSEATCVDVTEDALDWLETSAKKKPEAPFFLWVHYIEPHAPYRFHEEFADRLGINDDKLTRADRYDSEIVAVDQSIADLLSGIRKRVDAEDLLIVFAADHGESLGEHDYWGHGRYLYEPALRIPLGIVWEGSIVPRTVGAQASLLDLAPTLLDLAGIDVPEEMPGRNWANSVLGGDPAAEVGRCYQTHRGAVHGGTHDGDKARSKGLLWVGVVEGDRKEMLQVNRRYLERFDLGTDPGELKNLVSFDAKPSEALLACLAKIKEGLGSFDRMATETFDDETVEQLKALGYLE